MIYKQWKQASPSPGAVRTMQSQGVSPLVAAVLCARGLDTTKKAAAFYSPSGSRLADPFLLPDMDKAVGRVIRALADGEKIAVYGDYDVDGITAACLLTHYLRSEGGRAQLYIPDRIEEGYGLNQGAIDALHGDGATLLVTVDCGVTAIEQTRYANSLGMDVVITDHHECGDTLPDAAAVVNPHRKDSRYPFPHLAGVGVSFKLVLALGGQKRGQELLRRYCDLVALGTVADVVSLTGENRTLVRLGLKALAVTERPGLRALLRQTGAEDRAVTASTIGFVIAPRLNAAGRMGRADLAADLLLTADPTRAAGLAEELCNLNRQRQKVECEIFSRCADLLESGSAPAVRRSVVLAGEGWHQGVVGIVASRLAERYACPAFIICLHEGEGKGSCRSLAGFNLYEALSGCADLLESFGGHALAAGFTIREDRIPAFRARMDGWAAARADDNVVSSLDIDVEIRDPACLNEPAIKALSRLEPHGPDNPRPVFCLSGVTVTYLADVGGGKHLKLRARHGEHVFDAIFFSVTASQCALSAGDRADLAFYPQVNEYRGRRSVQLQLVDMRPASPPIKAAVRRS